MALTKPSWQLGTQFENLQSRYIINGDFPFRFDATRAAHDRLLVLWSSRWQQCFGCLSYLIFFFRSCSFCVISQFERSRRSCDHAAHLITQFICKIKLFCVRLSRLYFLFRQQANEKHSEFSVDSTWNFVFKIVIIILYKIYTCSRIVIIDSTLEIYILIFPESSPQLNLNWVKTKTSNKNIKEL